MFKQLEPFLAKADITMAMTMVDGKISISVLPKMKDKESVELQPIVIRGTAEQIDEGFVAALTGKLASLDSLEVDATAFDSSVSEAVESATATEKKKTEKAKSSTGTKKADPEKKEDDKTLIKKHMELGDVAMKEKKYDEAMEHFQKAADLLPEGKKKAALDKFAGAERWKKATDNMKASETVQTSLLEQPGVVTEEPTFDDGSDSGPDLNVAETEPESEEDVEINFE